MTVLHIDLNARIYRSVYQHARALAVAGDRDGANALMCNLLWHVEAADGGFIGLTDGQLIEKVALDPRLNLQTVMDAMYAPMPWPITKKEAA